MAFLGKIFDALRSTARRIFSAGSDKKERCTLESVQHEEVCHKSDGAVSREVLTSEKGLSQSDLETNESAKRVVRPPKIWEFNGERRTAAEWAQIYKVPVSTMRYRLSNRNSPEPPPQEYNLKDYIKQAEKHEYNGQIKTAEEWAEALGVSPTTFRSRLR